MMILNSFTTNIKLGMMNFYVRAMYYERMGTNELTVKRARLML